ncbi:DUF2971 domain-containing protein [Burkholderia ambifaria]|jgi:hypothetical protein|uniref:DUF2971 domain-containing protein n=1 Tax=Burkholderia ambifaria TaxID=152480 RepID=UPI001589D02E|nr:DUF2971 domain-containing protein [Burkholderia ambifaria]
MDTIYHYCDAAAFLSIITNKQLWLTNTRKMNDHSEGFVIEKALVDWVKQGIDGQFGNLQLWPDDSIDKVKHALAMGRPELYACCFSREKDSTSQWLNYADRARGFAIGFDPEKLWQNRLVPWNHSTFDGERYVVPVRFSNQPEERLTLTPVLYVNRETVGSILSDRLWGNTRDFLSGGSPDAMVNTASFFSSIAKDASFRHESELRLIYAPSVMPAAPGSMGEPHVFGTIKPMKWRASAYGLTPHFEFNFPVDAIREIWIGPANPEHKDHAARHLLSTLLNLHGVWDVQLMESRSPYR